jgi:hypothetical protein
MGVYWRIRNPQLPFKPNAHILEVTAMFRTVPTGFPPSSDIEVISITPVTGRGCLKAFASVRWGDIEIHGLRVMQVSPKHALVQLPVIEYTTGEGEPAFASVLKIQNPVLDSAIRQAVFEAWRNLQSIT